VEQVNLRLNMQDLFNACLAHMVALHALNLLASLRAQLVYVVELIKRDLN